MSTTTLHILTTASVAAAHRTTLCTTKSMPVRHLQNLLSPRKRRKTNIWTKRQRVNIALLLSHRWGLLRFLIFIMFISNLGIPLFRRHHRTPAVPWPSPRYSETMTMTQSKSLATRIPSSSGMMRVKLWIIMRSLSPAPSSRNSRTTTCAQSQLMSARQSALQGRLWSRLSQNNSFYSVPASGGR